MGEETRSKTLRLRGRDETALEHLKEAWGVNESEAIRRCIQQSHWLVGLVKDGGQVFIRKGASFQLKEVVFDWMALTPHQEL